MGEEYFQKRKMPSALVKATVKAREANKKFTEESKKWYETLQRKNLDPREKWLEFITAIAKGEEMTYVLDALQIDPRRMYFLMILEGLKAHGFPDEFLNELISEISPEVLSDKGKQYLRERIPLEVNQ